MSELLWDSLLVTFFILILGLLFIPLSVLFANLAEKFFRNKDHSLKLEKRNEGLEPFASFYHNRNLEEELQIGFSQMQEMADVLCAEGIQQAALPGAVMLGSAEIKDFEKNFEEEFETLSGREWEIVQMNAEKLIVDGVNQALKEDIHAFVAVKPAMAAGIFMLWNPEGELIFVEATANLQQYVRRQRSAPKLTPMRRSVAQWILELNTQSLKPEAVQKNVSEYLSNCFVSYLEVKFGRKEVMQAIVQHYHPRLNRILQTGNAQLEALN